MSYLLRRSLPPLLCAVGALCAAQAEPPEGWEEPKQIKTDAPAPEKLPKRLVLPPNITVTYKAGRIGEKPAGATPQAEKSRLSWDPDLIAAVIRRDSDAVLADYLWEGEARTSAYQKDGVIFRQAALEFPDDILVSTDAGALSLYLTMQVYNPARFHAGFPGLDWYQPETYAGTAKLRGKSMLLFSASKRQGKSILNDHSPVEDDKIQSPRTRADGTAQDVEAAEAALLEKYVLLDPETLLPLQMSDGQFQYVLSYSRNAAPLTVPKVLAAPVQKYFAARKPAQPKTSAATAKPAVEEN